MPDAPLHVFTSEDAAQLRASEVYTSGDVLQLRGGSPRKQREALSETAVLEFPEEQAAVDAAAEAEGAAKTLVDADRFAHKKSRSTFTPRRRYGDGRLVARTHRHAFRTPRRR